MDGSDSRSASSIAKACDDASTVLGKSVSSGPSPKKGSDGIDKVLDIGGREVAALREDVRVVMEKVVAVGDFEVDRSEDVRVVMEKAALVGDLGVDCAGDVFGLDCSTHKFDTDLVGDCASGDSAGGLRRALRSGIGGGEVMGSGFSIGVSKVKLRSDSGVAGGEGGRSGVKARASIGTLPYRLCGIRRDAGEPFLAWDSLFRRIAEARIGFEDA